MSARAELSSISTGLDELLARVDAIHDGLDAAERDSMGAELYELERTLTAAGRQISKLVDGPGRR